MGASLPSCCVCLAGCTFVNFAEDDGPVGTFSCPASFTNCAFVNNTGVAALNLPPPGILQVSGFSGNLRLENSTFTGNVGGFDVVVQTGSPSVYSDVEVDADCQTAGAVFPSGPCVLSLAAAADVDPPFLDDGPGSEFALLRAVRCRLYVLFVCCALPSRPAVE